MIPEDPAGYRITYVDEPGNSDYRLTRIEGDVTVGHYPTREDAVAAAIADAAERGENADPRNVPLEDLPAARFDDLT